MANRRPFRVSAPATPQPRSAEERKITAATEAVVGDREQADLRGPRPVQLPSEVLEGAGHGHSARIPWPADKPLEHNSKPFKNLKE